MKRTLATLALVAGATALAPAGASSAPIQPSGISAGSNIEAVQYRRGYYRHGGRHYYNGYRGYGYYRPGYRRYGEWWYPGAAFAAGALIGGAIASQPGPAYAAPAVGDAHVQWCMQTYRSYRPSDDTFQPYNGPRQPCVSPY
ncbi:MAG: hypothetical protein K0R27_3957 [Xanthobacteraceae bacterium]|jgi:hypothetical protein|nr:hypothetical protein [Xanthobacteraceae bacterium]